MTWETIAVLVLSVMILGVSIATLTVAVRIRRRNRKVEAWLVREMHAQAGRLEALEAMIVTQAQPSLAQRAAAARTVAKKRTAEPMQEPEPAAQPEPPAQAPATGAPLNLLSLINEMLTGNQPYNFIEAVRALDPTLSLERLTPSSSADLFTRKVYLQQGGDGLFALIQGDKAQLYPNYSRFSATLDPKPLFDGARHGARINVILQPAQLKRQQDGSWLLVHKGSVQMRQGE